MASSKFGDDSQVKFFYNHKFIGSSDPDNIDCPALIDLMESDKDAATQILNYMNHLGDPVFPVSEEDWGTPETNIDNVDVWELYSEFMKELDYEYADNQALGFGFLVDADFQPWDFEIFDGPVAEENVVESSTEIEASKFDGIPGYTPPKGGYLYIFKHGIGPGTIPDDVGVIKVKDLPNYYTAVWLDRFLTTPELKQYDIPDETRINELLGRIGYCQKNGDVVPCDDVQACGDIKASTMPKPTVDSVLKLIADNKIIFKNDVAYWSRGKGVLPKEYRDCIAQTEYAHWVNEWSCEQAEKYGDRAYYDYDGESEINSCSAVTASTTSESLGLEPRQRTAADGKTWWVVFDTIDQKYSTLTPFGKYTTKKECQYAIDKYKSQLSRTLGRGFAEDVGACTTVKASIGSTLQYADKVEFEDIYPSDRDISFFFTSDDAAYAKKLLGDVDGLVGFSIQVSLPKNYNGDWQEALIYISPKTEDGKGGSSDSDWTDITFDISDADMQSLVEQSWAEYKKRGWDDQGTQVTSSTAVTPNIANKIYSVMMNYEYGYDPDMTDIDSMLQELTSKGVHVDTSDAFKKAWVSAHNKAERKTWGSSGDANHYDSLTPRELEAIENYDTEYWEYVKDHPLNLKSASATDITSSTEPDFDVMGLVDQFFTEVRELVEYFRYHNKNLNKRQDELIENLSDALDSRSTTAAREAIENLNYNTKGMYKAQEYYVTNLYAELCYADGKYSGLGRNYADDAVIGSTKYTADMCSVGASDEGYEQLAEGDDADTTWTEPKYHAYSYYGKNYSGLEDDFTTDDPSALVDWIWDHAANGGYIEVDGPKDRIRLDPDDLAEQVDLGGIDEYGIISQIDNV